MTIYLYWYDGDHGRVNFGDSLSPVIVEFLSGKDVSFGSISRCDLCAMGSILDKVIRNRWKRMFSLRGDPIKIWGSGCLWPDKVKAHKGLDVFAVRGPLTRDAMGLTGSMPLGDPGLLAGELVAKAPKRYRWGIVPHIADQNAGIIAEMGRQTPNSVVIDLKNHDLLETIRVISSCEFVVSSSLHGVIVSDALGIPNIWTKISDNVVRADWKFRDYFLSVGRGARDPVAPVSDLRAMEPLAEAADRQIIETRQTELEESFRRMNL